MNLQKYNAFIKVEEFHSISKAASEMGYTQSAVSKMLAELEKEWGVVLFNRNHDGVELTAEGGAIIDDVRKLCAVQKQLDFSVASLHGINKGIIRLGAPISIFSSLIPNILTNFHNDYPGIKVELYEGEYEEISNLMRRGVIDVCVLPKPYSERYYSKTLLRDSLVAVLPINHSRVNEEIYPIKALETDEVIHLREVVDYDINLFLDRSKIRPNTVYEVSDDHTMFALVEKGLGVCIEYELLLKPLRYNVVIKPLDITKHRTLEICVKDREAVTPVLELFIAEVKRYIGV